MLFEIMITRSKSQITTITDLLASSDRLSQICNHTEKIKELQIKLCKNLDSPLNKHVVVADYQQKTLVLHTNSASWAARLRYMAPEILSFFQADMPGLSTIRVKVVLPDPPHQTSLRPVTVSPDTVDGIRQVADKIADPALRSTLSGIAKKLL